jgi:nucleoside-diphosphate-sugar epimerase
MWAAGISRGLMKDAVVLGASGFVGTRLVARLAGEGVRVRAYDLVPPRQVLPGVDYGLVDVRQAMDPATAAGAQIIYNLAAIHTTPGHLAHEYYEANVFGALNAVGLARAVDCPTIVFTSSISIYGPGEDLVTEKDAPAPTTEYGRSKLMAEQIYRQWLQTSPDSHRLVVARPGVIFGPGEGGNYTRLARALRRGAFAYPGRRTTIKSGGHVDELLSTFAFALARPDRDITFNFAYPEESTTEDIVRTFAEVAGFGGQVPTVPLGLLLVAAGAFEVAASMGLKTSIHRERVMKLVRSTRIAPGWLIGAGYAFNTDLRGALESWRDETNGRFE